MQTVNLKEDIVREEVKGDYLDMAVSFTSSAAPTESLLLPTTAFLSPEQTITDSRSSRSLEGGGGRAESVVLQTSRGILYMPIRKIAAYTVRRWNIFAEHTTTLHGVNEIRRAPLKKLKLIWSGVLAVCAAIMFYQIYMLTDHFLTEPTITTVSEKEDLYKLPLLLVVAPATVLMTNKNTKSGSGLDKEALIYARSLVDKNVRLPKGYNFVRGKKKFEKILNSRTGLTWHDLVEPHITDISDWLRGEEKNFRVQERSLWDGHVYHVMEPTMNRTALKENFVVEITLEWDKLQLGNSSALSDKLFLTSYGLLGEGSPFGPGYIYSIRFELTAHRSVDLRRKPCRPGASEYLLYDQQICKERCLLRAEQLYAPRRCYNHSLFNWGLFESRDYRPCSHGFFNASGGPYLREFPEKLKGGSMEKMSQNYEMCVKEFCLAACEQLSMKRLTDRREFAELMVENKALLFVVWPAPSFVRVYVQALQYTWDSFVGQIGGLIGLWLGASMISAFETIYLCCCCCYDLDDGEDEVEDEERIYGMGNEKIWYGKDEAAGNGDGTRKENGILDMNELGRQDPCRNTSSCYYHN